MMGAGILLLFLASGLTACRTEQQETTAVSLAALPSEEEDAGGLFLSGRIRNETEVIRGIRKGLHDNAAEITVSFRYGEDIFTELNAVIEAWMEAALSETEDPAEGDYIRYQYGGYTWKSSRDRLDDGYLYTVEITPGYYSYRKWEDAVTEETDRILRSLFREEACREAEYGIQPAASAELQTGGQAAGPAELQPGRLAAELPEAERIRRIYDYICSTVTYDAVHGKNPYDHRKSTAYWALIEHTAACQGYCTAMYRLLREAGVNCRIVTGTAGNDAGEHPEELHAWVIAEADGRYYNLDPTWYSGHEEYRWFLKGETDFPEHVREERFLREPFLSGYPMAETALTAQPGGGK